MKQWSRKHTACVACGGTARRHVGRGLCEPCWDRDWVKSNLEHVQRYKHEWYVANGGPALSKTKREQRYFNNQRASILKRDGHKCRQCGSPHQLVVHHEDGNGRGKPSPNNARKNLKTLCRKCHMKIHFDSIRIGRGFAAVHGWSPKHGLSACSQCGRSDRRHNGGGLCWWCYRKSK